VHGECRNGGLPDWLYGKAVAVRSNDERYLAYVKRWYAQIAQQWRGCCSRMAGRSSAFRLERYMHCGAPWEVTFKQGVEWVPAGEDGVGAHADAQATRHRSGLAGAHLHLYCLGGSPVPEREFLPMHGGYAFQPWNPDSGICAGANL